MAILKTFYDKMRTIQRYKNSLPIRIMTSDLPIYKC